MTAFLIEATDIEKTYHRHPALRGVSLTVSSGEFVALVGPSGCGKTTLLKILAGFEDPNRGALRIDGRDMTGVPPSGRPTRMVFQKLALFPHRTVGQNIAFPLMLAKVPQAEQNRRVREIVSLMHLRESYIDRYPGQLSGGEQQRVALARAMISSPSVLLLDEPLSALDAKLKKSLQAELKNLHRNVGTSFVHVTHDLEEAMMLADRIRVMRAGRIVQSGTPAEIYYRPVDAFVAGFIGDTNLLPVRIERRGDTVRFESPAVACAEPVVPVEQTSPDLPDTHGLLMIRPELVRLLGPEEEAPPCTVEGRVGEFFIKGASIQYRIDVDGLGPPMIVEVPGTSRLPADVGQPVRLGFRRADVFLLRE